MLIISKKALGAQSAAAQEVTIEVTTSDDNSGVDAIEVSDDAGFEPFTTYPATDSITEITWTPSKSTTVYARAVDRAGNRSTSTSVTTETQVFLPLVVKR